MSGLSVRQDHGEDERVGEEDQQRVDEAPEEAEHAAAVAGLELAGDEALDEGPVADERADRRDHARRAGLAARLRTRPAPCGRRRAGSRRGRRRGGRRRTRPRPGWPSCAPPRAAAPARRGPRRCRRPRSPMSARTFTRSGRTSHQPEKQVRRCQDPFLAVGELADPEGRHHRRVAGPHAEVALLAGGDDLVDLVAEEETLRGHDLERELRGERHGRAQPCIALACSWTSSMAPAM